MNSQQCLDHFSTNATNFIDQFVTMKKQINNQSKQWVKIYGSKKGE